MFDISHLLPAFASGFAFFAASILTLFLLTLGHKERITKAFAYTTAATALWGFFGFLFDITTAANIDLARVWKIGSQIMTPAIAAAVTNFAFVYYEENAAAAPRIYRAGRMIMFIGAIILDALLFSDLLGFSSLVVHGIILGPKNLLEPVPGPLFHGVYIHFFLAAFYTGYVIISVLKKNNTPLLRSQVKWIVWSLLIAMLAGATRFATWYHVPISQNIAAFAAPAFGIGISYAITRHRLFNIRVISAEIFTFSIWAFLFLVIIFSDTPSQRVINSISFVATIILGSFLIRGTLRESSQKEELRKTNAALKNFNQNLEEIVRERTEELTRAKLHTDAIIENLVLGLIEYKNDFTIVRVNKAAEELLGFARAHVIGKKITGDNVTDNELSSLAEVIHLDSAEKKYLNLKGTDVTGFFSEISVTHPIPRDLQIITFLVASEEAVRGKDDHQFVKIIRDITREKLIDQNKSDFIKIAAHQLRTPLSAIKWVFNLALEAGSAPLSKDQVEALKEGYQANERMINLINDLLNVVYIEDGRFGYEFQHNDITKTTTNVITNMRMAADLKKISLTLHLPDQPIESFLFDASRIGLALTNIVENAINYTQEGGHVDVSIWREGHNVKISVKDDGMGVPREEISKLLVTKFFRSVKALRAQTDGSGLGLYIANNIVKSHRGRIMIDSEENKGTTVTMTIPMTLVAGDEPKRVQAHATIEI
jgi:signal transduction histidine kinase